MTLSIIVAYGKDYQGKNVIGRDNRLPWHLPHDLARFREHTLGHAVVMGRKTFESIGRVLPRRDNIILSKSSSFKVDGAYVFADLKNALSFASVRNHEVFIIGGAEVYLQTLGLVNRLYITEVKNNSLSGDAFFPAINFKEFKIIQHEESPLDNFFILERNYPLGQQEPSFNANPYSDVVDPAPIFDV